LKDIEKAKDLLCKKDEDLPGAGQNYCVSCARHFITVADLKSHERSRPHKKRLKEALEDPHTQEGAEAAVGYSVEKTRKIKMGD
jgi:bud site selection protein 20